MKIDDEMCIKGYKIRRKSGGSKILKGVVTQCRVVLL